jgi:hypothetical protein
MQIWVVSMIGSKIEGNKKSQSLWHVLYTGPGSKEQILGMAIRDFGKSNEGYTIEQYLVDGKCLQ